MRERSRWPLLVAAGTVALLMAVAARYGWHRDELYFFAAGKRLAWGYVDFPPVVAVLSRLSSALFGESVVGLRLFPALALGATVLVAARMAADLGGGHTAQVLAALGVALTPVFLGTGHLMATATFELLAWAVLTWLVARLLLGGDERLWLAVGAVGGVAFLTKHSVVFLAAALVAAPALTPQRRHLRSPWLWAGAAVAAAIAAPNVAWHASHDWPVFDMLDSLQEESDAADAFLFLPFQLGMTGAAALLWVPGLVRLVRAPEAAPLRALAFAFVALAAVFTVTGAKPYYLAGFYPVLVASGALWWEGRGRTAVPVAVLAVAGLAALPLALPVLPPAAAADLPFEDLELELGAQLGWERLADEVARAQRDAGAAVVLTANYGEAGALRLYGPERGVHSVFSGHNNEWMWGPPQAAPGPVVLVGSHPEAVTNAFARCTTTWRFETPHGVASEQEGAPVVVCRRQLTPWSELWPRLRSYRA